MELQVIVGRTEVTGDLGLRLGGFLQRIKKEQDRKERAIMGRIIVNKETLALPPLLESSSLPPLFFHLLLRISP